ncbi:MAG: 50S ribosomal protein L32 [Candidatus Omnitrophica bacterium]|nr:50S ribosomal protein L32 [Candidatus Omnitrophota bacterium]
MALPKRHHTTSRQNKRRSHWKPAVLSLARCPQCAQAIMPHRVCPHCGYYRGRQVLTIATKDKEQQGR